MINYLLGNQMSCQKKGINYIIDHKQSENGPVIGHQMSSETVLAMPFSLNEKIDLVDTLALRTPMETNKKL